MADKLLIPDVAVLDLHFRQIEIPLAELAERKPGGRVFIDVPLFGPGFQGFLNRCSAAALFGPILSRFRRPS